MQSEFALQRRTTCVPVHVLPSDVAQLVEGEQAMEMVPVVQFGIEPPVMGMVPQQTSPLMQSLVAAHAAIVPELELEPDPELELPPLLEPELLPELDPEPLLEDAVPELDPEPVLDDAVPELELEPEEELPPELPPEPPPELLELGKPVPPPSPEQPPSANAKQRGRTAGTSIVQARRMSHRYHERRPPG